MLQDCSETMMVVCKIYEEGITKIMEPYVSKKNRNCRTACRLLTNSERFKN